MIEPQLLLELLVRLLANPTRLDGGGEPLEADVGRKIGEGVFAFARGAALAHQPGFGAGHMLHAFVMDSLRRSVGDPHANGGEGSGHRSLGSFLRLMRRHFACANISSADKESWSGICRLRGRPRPATGKTSPTSAG